MPSDPSILGFSNIWYAPALENAQSIAVGEMAILVVTAPYFVATKLEAFHGRGKNDFRMSRDLEDTISIVDGRSELVEEIRASPGDLQNYLSAEFRALLSNRDFMEALPGHLLPDPASQRRLHIVVGRMRRILLEG